LGNLTVKQKKALKKTPSKSPGVEGWCVWTFLALTAAALIPQYLIRGSYDTFVVLYNKLRTYPGDIWYCWSHYLEKGFPYPREYPSGLQVIFTFIHRFKPSWLNYESYFILLSLFLALFALATTLLLYNLVRASQGQKRRIILYWIAAPSFLYFGLFNMDLMTVFTVVIAYYLFLEEEYYLSAAMLALGTSIKVFPIFLAPLFFFACPGKSRLGSVLTFLAVWGAFNVPFMVRNWDAWSYPYQWQINENFAKSAKDAPYWWVLHKYLGVQGKWIGRLSLLLYAGLYYYFLKKKWDLPLPRKCAGIILLFLLTDRIYSPQYNLYLLPFLVLLDFDVSPWSFYTAEILGVVHCLFLFFWKETPPFFPGLYLQLMMIVKYAALIHIFMQIWNTPLPAGGWKHTSLHLPGEEGREKKESKIG
jgi:hypothetical protein